MTTLRSLPKVKKKVTQQGKEANLLLTGIHRMESHRPDFKLSLYVNSQQMNQKLPNHREQASKFECPKDQFLLCVVTAPNQQVSLYQIKGFYVEFITHAGRRGAQNLRRRPYHTLPHVAAAANSRRAAITLEALNLQRFTIYMN